MEKLRLFMSFGANEVIDIKNPECITIYKA